MVIKSWLPFLGVIMQYNLKEEPLVISKPTIDRIFQSDQPDSIALYLFYYYTAKWQNANCAKCTSGYAMNGLNIGRIKFTQWKKNLINLGLIEDIVNRNDKGQVGGNYIKVNFVHYKIPKTALDTLLSHTAENPLVGNQHTNALSTNSINALITNKTSIPSESKNDSNGTQTIINKYAYNPNINKEQMAFLKRIVSEFYQTKHKQYPNHIKSNWYEDDKLTHESVNVLYQLITIDKWGENDVRDVIRWATTDTFWQSNLLSLRILRIKSKNGMTKFANLHLNFTK